MCQHCPARLNTQSIQTSVHNGCVPDAGIAQGLDNPQGYVTQAVQHIVCQFDDIR